jgi:serine/threonine-protein kinase RsbW
MGATDNNALPAQLRVAAEASQLTIVRAVAAAIAGAANFDLDSISDVRLAVDEACTQLLRHAADDATLFCNFEPNATSLRVTVSVWPLASQPTQHKTFGWHVLCSLTDQAEMTTITLPDVPAVTSPAVSFTKSGNCDGAA